VVDRAAHPGPGVEELGVADEFEELAGGQLLGIDADPEAVRLASERLSSFRDSALLVMCDMEVVESKIAVLANFLLFPEKQKKSSVFSTILSRKT
jgi:hypothetical protein